MFCPSCGTQLPEGAHFCDHCGARLADYVDEEMLGSLSASSVTGGNVSTGNDAQEASSKSATSMVETTLLDRANPEEQSDMSGLDVVPEDTTDATEMLPGEIAVLSEDVLGARQDASQGNESTQDKPRGGLSKRTKGLIAGAAVAVLVLIVVGFMVWPSLSSKDLTEAEIEAYIDDAEFLVYDLPADAWRNSIAFNEDGTTTYGQDGGNFELESVEIVEMTPVELPDDVQGTYDGRTYYQVEADLTISDGNVRVSGSTELNFYKKDGEWVSDDPADIENPNITAVTGVNVDKVFDSMVHIVATSDEPFSTNGLVWTITDESFDEEAQTDVLVVDFAREDNPDNVLVSMGLTFVFDSSMGEWILYDAVLMSDLPDELALYDGLFQLSTLLEMDIADIPNYLETYGLTRSDDYFYWNGDLMRAVEDLEIATSEDGEFAEVDGTADYLYDARPAIEGPFTAWYATEAPQNVLDDLEAASIEAGDGTALSGDVVLLEVGQGLSVSTFEGVEGYHFVESDYEDNELTPDSIILTLRWDGLGAFDTTDFVDVIESHRDDLPDNVLELILADNPFLQMVAPNTTTLALFEAERDEGAVKSAAYAGLVEIDGEEYFWCAVQTLSLQEDGTYSTVSIRIMYLSSEVARFAIAGADLWSDEEIEETFSEHDQDAMALMFAEAVVQYNLIDNAGTRLNVLTLDMEECYSSDDGSWTRIEE